MYLHQAPLSRALGWPGFLLPLPDWKFHQCTKLNPPGAKVTLLVLILPNCKASSWSWSSWSPWSSSRCHDWRRLGWWVRVPVDPFGLFASSCPILHRALGRCPFTKVVKASSTISINGYLVQAIFARARLSVESTVTTVWTELVLPYSWWGTVVVVDEKQPRKNSFTGVCTYVAEKSSEGLTPSTCAVISRVFGLIQEYS